MHAFTIFIMSFLISFAGPPVDLPKPSGDKMPYSFLSFEHRDLLKEHASKFILDDSGRLWCTSTPIGSGATDSWFCIDMKMQFSRSKDAFGDQNIDTLLNQTAVKRRFDYLEEQGTKVYTHFVVDRVANRIGDALIGELFDRDNESSRVAYDYFIFRGTVDPGDVLYFNNAIDDDGGYFEYEEWVDGKQVKERVPKISDAYRFEIDDVCSLRPTYDNGAFPALNTFQLAAELYKRKAKSFPVWIHDEIKDQWYLRQEAIVWEDGSIAQP